MIRLLTPSHRRAQRLIDVRLDAERGEGPHLSEVDARWLDGHLEGCARCAAAARERRALLALLADTPPLFAPAGFAERLRVRAAREGARAEAPRRGRTGWALTAGAAVAAVALLAGPVRQLAPLPSGEVQVGGAAHLEAEAPHFVIRAPRTGAARFRHVATRVVESHGGRLTAGAATLGAVIPRDELVGFMAELEGRGGFEVELVHELEDHATQVELRFDLD